MTNPTLNNPARTFNAVVATLNAAFENRDSGARGCPLGIFTVYATLPVALDWMEEDSGNPTTEFGSGLFWVRTLPLGKPSVNAQGEAVHALKFEYAYGISDPEVDPYAPDSDYDR